jgi:hypothetical protein
MTLAEKIGELLSVYNVSLSIAAKYNFADPYKTNLRSVQTEIVEILRSHLEPRDRPEFLLFHERCYQVCYRAETVTNTCARTEFHYDLRVPYVSPVPASEEVSAESASVLSV